MTDQSKDMTADCCVHGEKECEPTEGDSLERVRRLRRTIAEWQEAPHDTISDEGARIVLAQLDALRPTKEQSRLCPDTVCAICYHEYDTCAHCEADAYLARLRALAPQREGDTDG